MLRHLKLPYGIKVIYQVTKYQLTAVLHGILNNDVNNSINILNNTSKNNTKKISNLIHGINHRNVVTIIARSAYYVGACSIL